MKKQNKLHLNLNEIKLTKQNYKKSKFNIF